MNRSGYVRSIGAVVWMIVCLTVWLNGIGTSAAVYDDTKAWWHFDYDANSNSQVELAEITDQLRFSNGGGYKATGITGSFAWTTSVPLVGPGGGQSYGGTGLAFTPAAASNPDSFSVSGLALSAGATVATRMQWNGYNTGQSYGWLYKNAYDGSQGWLAGFEGATSPQFKLLLGTSTGGKYYACPWTWTIGAWYDFAFAINDDGDSDSITFYRWADGGQFESQTVSVGNSISSSTIGGNTLIGSENTGASGNGLKAFSGTLDNLAVWDRTLSASEIHEVFGASHSVWSVGVEDNSPYDMQHESSVSDANYTPGQPWNEMPRAVSASLPSAFVNFDLTAEQAALSQVFHLDLDGFGSGATAEVKLNGVSLGSVSQAEGTQYSWLIAANKFQVGSNTLEISRTGGSYVAWDWMELGGSWQLGIDDGDHADELHSR